MLLSFLFIGASYGSDVSDNENFISKNDLTISNGLYKDSDNLNGFSDSKNGDLLNQADFLDNQSSNQSVNQVDDSHDSLNIDNNSLNSINSNSTNSTNSTNSNNLTNSINSTNSTNFTNFDSGNSNFNENFLAAGDGSPIILTQSQILLAANSVYNFILKNKKLPNYVTIAGNKFTMPEFLYMMSKTIVYKYNKIVSDITVKSDVKNPKNPTGNNIKVKMSSKHYYKYANNIANFIEKNNIAPNFVTTSWGKSQYQTTIFAFSKLLSWSYFNKGTLPKSVSVTVSKSHSMNKYLPSTEINPIDSGDSSKNKVPSIINNPYNGESLLDFLNPSKNCQSTDPVIKSLATSITKNCKTEFEKATAIFNWVRDKVSYSFYYNTKKGAIQTLNTKNGNCVDQTHLLISLMRASGIAAKYVNGKATFTSGSTYGHVWAQVLIGDTWFVADTTSSKNSLGTINNWKTSTATIYGTYSSISF